MTARTNRMLSNPPGPRVDLDGGWRSWVPFRRLVTNASWLVTFTLYFDDVCFTLYLVSCRSHLSELNSL